jgi:hypothetical protein
MTAPSKKPDAIRIRKRARPVAFSMLRTQGSVRAAEVNEWLATLPPTPFHGEEDET